MKFLGSLSAPLGCILYGWVLLYFAFQTFMVILGGYSDIAIAPSKLFGFELMSNFKFPYFFSEQVLQEFWEKGMISLFSWASEIPFPFPLGDFQIW